MKKSRFIGVASGLALCFGLVGCATLSERYQPSLSEPYGIIKAGNGIFIEHIDDKHMGLGLYGYKGDIRVSPGEHIIGMHYDSPGLLFHYSGSKLLLRDLNSTSVYTHVSIEPLRQMLRRYHPRELAFADLRKIPESPESLSES